MGNLRVDVGNGEGRGVLAVHDLSQASLALDDAVGHVELAAKRGQKEHDLDGVDVVRDDDQLRLLVLDELRHGVDAEADDGRTLADLLLLAVSTVLGALLQALQLRLLRLRTVLVQELEELGS